MYKYIILLSISLAVFGYSVVRLTSSVKEEIEKKIKDNQLSIKEFFGINEIDGKHHYKRKEALK